MHAVLTDRQERFVFEYLKDQNASAAAARAGYTAKNLAQQGNELMNNPAVRERVRLEMQSLLAEVRCSALELMKQRMRAAFLDPRKLFSNGWEPLALEELDEETRAALEVSTVMRKNGPVVRVKQMDRSRALRALEKVHERLDRLNEQHWAKLEREGKVMSLAEIDAMDAQEPQASPVDFAKKHQVLSGPAGMQMSRLGAAVAAAFQPSGDSRNAEKHQVLSGSRLLARAAPRVAMAV